MFNMDAFIHVFNPQLAEWMDKESTQDGLYEEMTQNVVTF